MPAWLYKQLQRGPNISRTNTMGSTGRIVQVESVANESPGIVPILAQLYTKDSSVSKVFLCHPSVKHIFKTPREGGFCGYRNIQMLISFMQGTRYPGCQYFPGRTPSIPRLQDMIESAWDLGFNSIGRVETGGIRGTRKYIGTPEVKRPSKTKVPRCILIIARLKPYLTVLASGKEIAHSMGYLN